MKVYINIIDIMDQGRLSYLMVSAIVFTFFYTVKVLVEAIFFH